jgi:flagellar basal-body rod protein FlgC
MSWFDTLHVAQSGVSVASTRMSVIAENLANAEATRTPEGGPYRRQVALLGTAATGAEQRPWEAGLSGPDSSAQGVRVVDIVDAPDPTKRVYEPSHPDADAQGYVEMPNVDVPMEMVDLTVASRIYQANIAAMQTVRRSLNEAISLLG